MSALKNPSHNRTALLTIVSKTGFGSVGELAITFRISLVAVSRARLAARRFSRSRTLARPFSGGLRAIGALASTLAFAAFVRRPIGVSALDMVKGPGTD